MTSIKQKIGKNSNWPRKPPLLLIFIILILFSSIAILLNNSSSLYSMCLNDRCTALNNQRSLDYLQNFNQNIEIELSLKTPFKSIRMTKNQNVTPGSIYVFGGSQSDLVIGIPMQRGSSKLFPISVPISKTTKLISLHVYDGKEFVIEADHILVYSHRYVAPIFYVNPTQICTIEILDAENKNIAVIKKISIDYNITSHTARRTLGVIIFLLFFGFSWLLKELLVKRLPQKRAEVDFKITSIGLIFFWLSNLILWVSGPRDDTGTLNPSPFGPIGAAFSDMMQIFQAGKFNHPYFYQAVNYPPFALSLIRIIPGLSEGLLVLVISIISTSCLWWLSSGIQHSRKMSNKAQKIFVFLLPYPVVFSLVRGNLDLFVSVIVGMSLVLIDKGYAKSATFLFGMAIALKVWPVIFVLLFLKKKNYRVVFGSLFVAGVLTSLSFSILGYGNLATQLSLLVKTLGIFNGSVIPDTFIYSYSFGALIFVVLLLVNTISGNGNSTEVVARSIHFFFTMNYLVILISLLIAIGFFVYKSKRVDGIFFFCASLSLLSSSLSYTYRGCILVVALLVRANFSNKLLRITIPNLRSHLRVRRNQIVSAAALLEVFSWLCILSPTTFIYAHQSLLSTSSVLQPLAVLYLVCVEYAFEQGAFSRLSSRLIYD